MRTCSKSRNYMPNAHPTLKLLFNNISMLLFKTFKFSQTNNMSNLKIK
jgi:hypothetical protein